MTQIHEELDMVKSRSICNYTRTKTTSNDDDEFSGTLAAAALQCILEYTTRPGDIVLTLNAQFGAIFDAADNCGRLVFGTEGFSHFGNAAKDEVIQLLQQRGTGAALPLPSTVGGPDVDHTDDNGVGDQGE